MKTMKPWSKASNSNINCSWTYIVRITEKVFNNLTNSAPFVINTKIYTAQKLLINIIYVELLGSHV